MIQEFVTYEQALDLAKLKFNEKCFGYYGIQNELNIEISSNLDTNLTRRDFYAAPTFSQAFRWFIEKYNLVFNFISYNIVKPGEYHWSITWNDEAKASGIVKTYEEAELACLIKLIEICKNK